MIRDGVRSEPKHVITLFLVHTVLHTVQVTQCQAAHYHTEVRLVPGFVKSRVATVRAHEVAKGTHAFADF